MEDGHVIFYCADVQELVGILANESAPIARESPGSLRRCNQLLSVVRPSRVRSMLPSQACRSSIMIGNSLSKKEMEKVSIYHTSQSVCFCANFRVKFNVKGWEALFYSYKHSPPSMALQALGVLPHHILSHT